MGHGARALECVPGEDETLIVHCFVDWKWQQALGTVRCTTEDLVDDAWKDIAFVQCFVIAMVNVEYARNAVPDVPHLGRMYET